MALDVLIGGANVDSNGNTKVTLPVTDSQAGYSALTGLLSTAGEPAGLVSQPVRVSAQGRLAVGQPVTLLNKIFNNTAINSAIFTAPVTTMTVTFAGGTANINAAAGLAINTNARLATYQFFPMFADFALFCTMDMLFTQSPQANAVTEIGFLQCSAATAPTDGCFFRFDATGTLKAVLNNGGTEITSSALSAPSNSVMHKYKIVIENDRALFFIDGLCQAIIAAPTAQGFPTQAQSVPWACRHYIAGSAPSLGSTIKVGYVFVGQQDASGMGKDNATLNAVAGGHGSQGQDGHTVGTTALYSNSLAVGAGAAATNTTAALGSGLGGQFALQPTLAAATDGIISSYQNPAATAAIPGKMLYIKGVWVDAKVTTAFTGGPCYFAMSLAYGHTAVSLATAEAAATKAARRIPLGWQSFVVTSPVGQKSDEGRLYCAFQTPVVVNPGEFVQVVAKNAGTVTSAGVVAFLIGFDAYFE